MLNKDLLIQIDSSSWPNGAQPPVKLLTYHGVHKVNLLVVLIHVALRTRLPLSYGISLNDMWSWLRYFPAFISDNQYRLREEWDDLDPHQKVILSDDLGMGFSSYILTDALELVAVAPTNYLLNNTQSLILGNTGGKRGPKKSPDFIGIDKKGKLHIFECKGTQSKQTTLYNQLNNGKQQKNNIIDSGNLIGERIVSGIFIPQYKSNEDAVLLIQDPDYDIYLDESQWEDLAIHIIMGEMASSIHFLGIPQLANCIATNNELDPMIKRRILAETSPIIKKEKDAVFIEMKHNFDYLKMEINNKVIHGLKAMIGFDYEIFMELLEVTDFYDYCRNNLDFILNDRPFTTVIDEDEVEVNTPLGLKIKLSLF